MKRRALGGILDDNANVLNPMLTIRKVVKDQIALSSTLIVGEATSLLPVPICDSRAIGTLDVIDIEMMSEAVPDELSAPGDRSYHSAHRKASGSNPLASPSCPPISRTK
jgi:hypothetical protein